MAFFFGDWHDSVIVWGLIFINCLIGFYQELKAKASIKGLKTLTRQKVVVIKDGKETEIDAVFGARRHIASIGGVCSARRLKALGRRGSIGG